jgi:hypothetical protein
MLKNAPFAGARHVFNMQIIATDDNGKELTTVESINSEYLPLPDVY